MTDAAALRRRRIIDIFDTALDQPAEARAAWLRAHHGDDLPTIAAVEALIAADAAPTILPDDLRAGDDLAPPERVGVYRLTACIGRGGMGEVWRAERDDGLFDHHVAIKLMRPARLGPQLTAFFDRERRLLARMRHPGIARLFDGGVSAEGVPWFAMDLIDGVAVDRWSKAQPPPGFGRGSAREDVAMRVRLAIRIGEAVQHAHQSLIVHADLKSENILVDAAGEPRLVDFGIAHLVAAADDPAVGRAYPRTDRKSVV